MESNQVYHCLVSGISIQDEIEMKYILSPVKMEIDSSTDKD